jgi:hypothetical protein
MTWLAECSAVALGEALRVVAPELSGYPVTVPGPAGKQDPQWHSGCVPVGEQCFVKFAWSRPAALQLAHEIGVLAALAREPAVPFLPEVVASSTDPLLLITKRVQGASMFDIVDSIDPDRTARQRPKPSLTTSLCFPRPLGGVYGSPSIAGGHGGSGTPGSGALASTSTGMDGRPKRPSRSGYQPSAAGRMIRAE